MRMPSLPCRPIPLFLGGMLLAISVTSAVAQQDQAVFATQDQLRMLEMRLDRLERVLDSAAMTEMLQRLQQQSNEIRQLRGQVEGLEHELQNLRTRQRDQFRTVDERVTFLESRIDSSAAVPSPLSGLEELPNAEEQQAYEAAFEHLMAGDYDAAVQHFERFLSQFPRGAFSANALYWLAEARYALSDYAGALQDFAAMRERYPDSERSGDALLKMGFSEWELERYDAATQTLQQVVENYPGTVMSRLAGERLRRILSD